MRKNIHTTKLKLFILLSAALTLFLISPDLLCAKAEAAGNTNNLECSTKFSDPNSYCTLYTNTATKCELRCGKKLPYDIVYIKMTGGKCYSDTERLYYADPTYGSYTESVCSTHEISCSGPWEYSQTTYCVKDKVNQ